MELFGSKCNIVQLETGGGGGGGPAKKKHKNENQGHLKHVSVSS